MRHLSTLLLVALVAVTAFAAKERNLDKGTNVLVVRPPELTVTMDVKDMETRKILKEMQKQCAVKNLIVDPDVPEEKGTFKFTNVSCSTAFKVVFRSLRLDSVTYSNALVNISKKK